MLISEEKKMLNAIEEHQDFTDRLENERQTAISTMEKEFAELEALITERKKAYLDSIESSIRRKGGSEKGMDFNVLYELASLPPRIHTLNDDSLNYFDTASHLPSLFVPCAVFLWFAFDRSCR